MKKIPKHFTMRGFKMVCFNKNTWLYSKPFYFRINPNFKTRYSMFNFVYKMTKRDLIYAINKI